MDRRDATDPHLADLAEFPHLQPADLKNLSEKLYADTTIHTVIIAGHSNTTPALAGVLMGETIFDQGFDESDYENILVVNVNKDGTKKLHQLKYHDELPSKSKK